MAREDQQIRIRLPADLKEEIELAAKANNRSVNAEVLARMVVARSSPTVEERLEWAEGHLEGLDDRVRWLEERMEKLDPSPPTPRYRDRKK